MYKGILIISISALLSHQVNSESVVPFGVADDAKSLYDEMWQVSIDGLNGALADYKTFSDLVSSATSATLEDGLNKISDKSEEYISLVSSIKDSASSTGLDITSCLGPESTINNLKEINSQDLTTCLNYQNSIGINYLNGRINYLTSSLFNQVYAEESKLVSCVETDTKCINDLVQDLQKNVGLVTSKITTTVENDRQTVEKQVPGILACIDASMSKIEDMGGSMTSYIQNCVADLIA